MRILGLAASFAVTLATACGGSAARPPAQPEIGSPPGSDLALQITGRERIGWIQTAESADNLRFAVYLDDTTRIDLPSASCTRVSGLTFSCESPLPPLTNGRHSLELVARFASSVDSGRAPLLLVNVDNASP